MVTWNLLSGESPPIRNRLGPLCLSKYSLALMALSTSFCLCESSCWAVPGTETEGWSIPNFLVPDVDVTPMVVVVVVLYVIGTGMADWRWSRLGEVSELFEEAPCWKPCFEAIAWAYVDRVEEGVLRERLGPWGAVDSTRMCSGILEMGRIESM